MMNLNETEVAYGMEKTHRGKGYATGVAEALTKWTFETFSLPYVVATILPDNIASLKVIEKIGKWSPLFSKSAMDNQVYLDVSVKLKQSGGFYNKAWFTPQTGKKSLITLKFILFLVWKKSL